jgi:SOS-response transcriptional repressor LexA
MPTMRAEERPVTPRPRQFLEFIRRYLRAHGRPTTTRRIGSEFGIASPYAVLGSLRSLVRKGLLQRDEGEGGWCTYRPIVPPGHCPCCGQPLPGE